jgi:hypothetical protein
MVIICGHLAGMLISPVAVDRIKDAHAAAVLEDEKKVKGIQYLFGSCLAPLTNNSTEREEQLRKRQSMQQHDRRHGGGRSWFRFLMLGSRPRLESKPKPTWSGSKNAGKVKVNEIGMYCVIPSSTQQAHFMQIRRFTTSWMT